MSLLTASVTTFTTVMETRTQGPACLGLFILPDAVYPLEGVSSSCLLVWLD